MRHFIHRLAPARRAKLVRFLELASDNPYVRPDVRRRIERHLGKIKTELRFAELVHLVVREADGA
jgi:hypothetical protein